MQPTLRNGQHCLLNRWVYLVRAPRRGDVVVLRDPTDNGLAVKRIIGVAGDRVELSSGDLILNGSKLKEPYLREGLPTYPGPKLRQQTIECHEGQYVVMGDNRMNSADSRNYGAVGRENILGLIVP
jgi:signal peptidase I